jgi:hypothetical protein
MHVAHGQNQVNQQPPQILDGSESILQLVRPDQGEDGERPRVAKSFPQLLVLVLKIKFSLISFGQ